MRNQFIKKLLIVSLYLATYLVAQLFFQLLLVDNPEIKKQFLYISIGMWIVTIILVASIRFLREKGCIISVILNGIAASLAIHAYMLHIESELPISILLFIVIGSIAFFMILSLITPKNFIKKHEIIFMILIITIILASILLWIFLDKAIYSQVFFALIMTIAFYVGSEAEGTPGSTLGKMMMYSSFGSIFIIITVAMIIFSSGEFLEGLVPSGEFKRNPKKPRI